MARTTNPNCDNNKCTSPSGEVRLLPTIDGGNMIVCRACYDHEMSYRRGRNTYRVSVNEPQLFSLPAWEDLKVYDA